MAAKGHHPEAEEARVNVPEPRWPAVLGLLAVGLLYVALPESLSLGPSWLLLAIVCILLVPTILTHRRGHPLINRVLGHALSVLMTAFMLASVGLLVHAAIKHEEPPTSLLRSAAALWATNVLVFASWYWRLDAGGPHGRAQRLGHPTGAFLFPQMAADPRHAREADGRPWSPRFADYLFLAFNTSTALSPTDSPVLSRWAKLLMMMQSAISLAIIAILVSRAVNIL
jgi:hypothetical protein